MFVCVKSVINRSAYVASNALILYLKKFIGMTFTLADAIKTNKSYFSAVI